MVRVILTVGGLTLYGMGHETLGGSMILLAGLLQVRKDHRINKEIAREYKYGLRR